MPSNPLILAFDTSVAHCAAALLSGDEIIAHTVEEMSKGQAERLFPLLEEMLAAANSTWADLTAIGVGIGPGNFTGIRISVSAARGLALSLGIPAVGVSTFEAQALDLARPIHSLIDARRDQVYLQTLSDTEEFQPELISAEQAQSLRSEPTVGMTPTGNIAVNIVKITAQRFADPSLPRPAPLYVRTADAAPPRDPAPVILP